MPAVGDHRITRLQGGGSFPHFHQITDKQLPTLPWPASVAGQARRPPLSTSWRVGLCPGPPSRVAVGREIEGGQDVLSHKSSMAFFLKFRGGTIINNNTEHVEDVKHFVAIFSFTGLGIFDASFQSENIWGCLAKA